jgi:hypothetical protein
MPACRKLKIIFSVSLIRICLHALTYAAVTFIVVYNTADREHNMTLHLPPSRARIQSYVQHFNTTCQGQ